MTVDQLALHLICGKVATADLPPEGYTWRKGKGVQAVRDARAAGLREGRGKTEFEIEWTQFYLERDVFKKLRRAAGSPQAVKGR